VGCVWVQARVTVFFFAGAFFDAVFLAAAAFGPAVFCAVLPCADGGAAFAAGVLAVCGFAGEAGALEAGALDAALVVCFEDEGAAGAPVLLAAWPNNAAATTNDVTTKRFRNYGNP